MELPGHRHYRSLQRTRPLKVPGQPEKRRYRICFWDGDPSHVWTSELEVTYGG